MTARQTAAKWGRMRCLPFDLESTGVNPHEDRIVQAAIVDINPGAGRPKATSWLADPGIDIPEGASAIHGITTERARAEGQDIGQVLFELTGRLALALGHGIPVVGFNISYDLTMLEAENRRHGIDTLASRLDKGIAPVVDAFVLDKYADPYRKGGRKLEAVCAAYGVRHTGAHDAEADALAAGRLWPRILEKHAAKFRGFLMPGLHVAQQGWRAEQMKSLREYFDKQGTVHDGCCGEWPVHTRCVPVAVAS